MNETVALGTIDTPMGAFGAVTTNQGLACLTFPGEPLESCARWVERHAPNATVARDSALLQRLQEQLSAYLEGNLRHFDVPLDLRGTPFQQAVWRVLTEIPYGETRSYRWVAERIGNPAAVRAVGLANGRNPVPIVVPCHRVIGSNGTLTGYGGGLTLKERLLALEGIGAAQPVLL